MNHRDTLGMKQPNIDDSDTNLTSNDMGTSINNYEMHTRSRVSIHKPKLPYIGLTETSIDTMEPATSKEAFKIPLWEEAIHSEFQELVSNHTWTLLPYQGQEKLIDSRWVFKIKYKAVGSIERRKAQLVAKGFQQTDGLEYEKTSSHVIKERTIMIILLIVVHLYWEVEQLDINNAFLNGYLKEMIYMHQLEGFIDLTKTDHI